MVDRRLVQLREAQTVQRFEHLPVGHECSLHGSGGQHRRLLASRGGVVVVRRDGRVMIVICNRSHAIRANSGKVTIS